MKHRQRDHKPSSALRVLICPDKFKGTLNAADAAAAIARGWRRSRPADRLELLPISDGGDGFGELLGRHLGAQRRTVSTVDAAHRAVRACWWWEPRRRVAIIESARVIGLAMLPAGRFHPFDLDTCGLGRVLEAAARLRPRRCLVGVGGSATNDGGFGLARALGWDFRDESGNAIERWTQLHRLAQLRPPRRRLPLGELIVATDVRNRLLGPAGCSRVYGSQKGLRPEDFPVAEAALQKLARVFQRHFPGPTPLARQPGAGAAGGLGFGLCAWAGAQIESGFELFASQAGLLRRLEHANLVLTGEGAIDDTTVRMGKGVGQVARLCRRRRVPCVGLAGVLKLSGKGRGAFTALAALTPDLAGAADAKARAAYWLEEMAARVGAAWPTVRA